MRESGFWILILVLTTRGTPVRLRLVVGIMLLMAAFLVLISFTVGGPHPMPLRYITLVVLLFGVAQYFGPRVRSNLRLWYPKQMKRYERVEPWALVAILVWQGVRLLT